jgi:DNA (cytosine-5)-methyltransferase 1
MTLKFIDLFCGIGGFRIAAEPYSFECVFSSDIDADACRTYEANFHDYPSGDITQINGLEIPNHDILFGGFPCQPFSIIGQMNGMSDTRGTLFFDIARILEAKKPRWFLLENVKQLVGHDNGHTFKRISEILDKLGYQHKHRVFNALNFGLPQKRERVFIVGSNIPSLFSYFEWPEETGKMKPLSQILENNVPDKYLASSSIQQKRLSSHISNWYPSIWHENKAGHISSYPFSCALRANASYNYLLVNGIRRLTPREQLRLQGFPDWFRITGNDAQIRKQTGNSLPVPIARAIIRKIVLAEEGYKIYGTEDKTKTKVRTTVPLEPVPS